MSHEKKHFTSHYWLSLMTMLIPVVIFGIFIYIYNINSNKNYIEQTRLSSFQQASAQIGYMLEVLKGIAAEADPDALDHEAEDFSGSIALMLNEMEQKAPLPVSAYYYAKGDKYIYSNIRKMLYQDFEALYENNYNFSRPRLFYRLNSSVSPCLFRFYLQDSTQDSASLDGLLAFICPIDDDSRILFLMPESSLREIFIDYFGEIYGTLLVYNNSLDVILSTQPNNEAALDNALLRIKGTGILPLEESGQIALRQTIGLNEMTIISVMDKKDFYQQLNSEKLVLFLLILLMIICCLILLSYGIRQVRKPLHALVQDFAEEYPGQTDDELELLHHAFTASRERTLNLQNQLTTRNSLLTEHFAQRLINGYFQSSEEIFRTADYLDITIRDGSWVAMELLAEQPFCAQDLGFLDPDASFLPKECTLLTTEVPWHPGLCCILNYTDAGSGDQMADLLAHTLEDQFRLKGFSLSVIGVGTPCQDPLRIKHSFFEADAAAISASECHTYGITFYRQNHKDLFQSYTLPAMEKSLLTSGIRRGETEIALSALETLFSSMEAATKSFLYLQLFANSLANLLLQLAQENDFALAQEDWADLVAFQSAEDFHSCVTAFTEKLCEQFRQHSSHVKLQEKDEVLSFIKKNYTREDFSLDYTADTLNMSKVKINAYIKENIDLGFQQYVTLLRMNEMKRLLIETDEPVSAIIRKVGYLDVSSSIRKFKTLEGVTPGQYRSLHCPGI